MSLPEAAQHKNDTPPPATGESAFAADAAPSASSAAPAKAPRVRLLDTLRGFAVLNMVLYHALYDMVWIFGYTIPWYTGTAGYLWQQGICFTFILVSGATLHYSGHPVRRGLLIFGCGLLVSVVTLVFMPEEGIWFGILHFIGLAMLAAALLRPLLAKIPGAAGLALCLLLFLVLKGFPYGFAGFADMAFFSLPESLYTTSFLFPLGLPGPQFQSSDYFPFIPWFFLYLTGYFGWGLCKGQVVPTTYKPGPLTWAGRHSLLLYMAHQPVVYGLLWVCMQLFA